MGQPHDAIDFTDNDIQLLGNFPLSPRLTTLLFARNRISHIQPTVCKNVPFLQNLVLISNHFVELADLDALAGFRRLTHLVLIDNPITKHEHYRFWVLWRCPSVRFLDYIKVKKAEREQAVEMFGTSAKPTELASKVSGEQVWAIDLKLLILTLLRLWVSDHQRRNQRLPWDRASLGPG